MTDGERASRWPRRFVLAGAALLLLWQVAELVGLGRRVAVTLRGVPAVVTGGRVVAGLGAAVHLAPLIGLFCERYG